MATLRDKIEYGLLRGLIWPLQRLPLRLSVAIGAGLGGFLYHPVGLRREVTLQNLRTAFPDMSEEELQQLAQRVYRNFGRMLAEFVREPRLSPEFLVEHVEFVNEDVLRQAVDEGKGGILVTGHFGNWEWMAAALCARGYEMQPIVAEQRNRLVEKLIDDFRAAAGVKVIKFGAPSVRQTLKLLRKNKFVGILVDQDAGRNGEFVPFFGRPASTPKGPAVFHLKTGSPLIFLASVRLGPGRHRVYCERLEVETDGQASDENVHTVTAAITSRLEHWVRRYPDHWFWMHRRWKSSHWAEQGARR
ncbi:MAG: lysophospholipid acyltransferase family protein [Calditrichaeota bacterium]|nr:lysophospholipid acyltransferase family protein [Calditrichota bacterium]